MKPVLTIRKESAPSGKQVAALRKDGYHVLIVRYHDDVRLTDSIDNPSAATLLNIATKAIGENEYHVREHFNAGVTAHILASLPKVEPEA